ncbi:LLM class flavin-dependent oxidoreductase [Bacillus sp. FSL H8-0547]
MKLSILDQSPISEGFTAKDALAQSLHLVKEAEKLGYCRYWFAEHHNTSGLASTAPEILMAHAASHTERIKVGSGGVLLPQYSPLKVAETFRTLETLFPNRIDLGIGRSPGGSAETRLALTDGLRKSMNEFPRQLKDLRGYLSSGLPEDHAFSGVQAMPDPLSSSPDLWLLGISHRGARVAAEHGMAFTYGHFINPVGGEKAMEDYRKQFKPVGNLKEPKTNFCIFAVCAESQEKAEYLASSQDAWLLQVESGGDTRIISPDQARKITFNEDQKSKIRMNRKRMLIGTPERIKEDLLRIADDYKTDEALILTNIYDFKEKRESYRLLAEAFQTGSCRLESN